MQLKNDKHGVVFSDENIKLYYPTHTWNMKALFSNNSDISIITNSFADMTKFVEQINKKPGGKIRIICNTLSVNDARKFALCASNIDIRHKGNISAKIFLRADGRIYVGSEDMGNTDKTGVSIGFSSKEAYESYMKDVFEKLWINAEGI